MPLVKHGHSKRSGENKTYRSWKSMMRRTRPNDSACHLYADRGITVCDRWRDYRLFLADMGEKPQGTSLDRIDNNAGYFPGNCRWGTPEQQQNNRRNNTVFTYGAETLTVKQWSDRYKIPYRTLLDRLIKGVWSVERALNTPVDTRYSHGVKISATKRQMASNALLAQLKPQL